MSNDNQSRFALLERFTALVLLLVLAALGWMLVVANQPEWNAAHQELQVIVVLVLLAVALVLVSVVALVHTR